jgi:hypothetical protein
MVPNVRIVGAGGVDSGTLLEICHNDVLAVGALLRVTFFNRQCRHLNAVIVPIVRRFVSLPIQASQILPGSGSLLIGQIVHPNIVDEEPIGQLCLRDVTAPLTYWILEESGSMIK